MKGSCLCKAVEYEIDQLDMPIGHCSCQTCRKAHAAAFNSSAGVYHHHFRWLKGEEKLSAYESSPGKQRYFCSGCGSHLVATLNGRTHVILRVATLDDEPGQRPEVHIWKSHEVPWVAWGDALPSHAEWPPDRS